jgi:hypothetical protein
MATKRAFVRRARHAITPEAIEAFANGDWGGLHRALGLRPWECSPLDATEDFEPGKNTAWATSVEQARRLRAELLSS